MAKEGDNSFGVASVVLGILSILSSIIFPIALILGVTSLIFGLIQRKNHKNNWATSGIVLGVAGIILSLLVMWWFNSVLSSPDFQAALSQAQQVQQLSDQIPTQ